MVPWSHRSKSFAFSALTRLGGRKGIRPVKKLERWGAGVVICLERDADLHMVQLMPLPLTVSCFSKIQTGLTFLLPAYPGSPGKRAVKRVCVCVGPTGRSPHPTGTSISSSVSAWFALVINTETDHASYSTYSDAAQWFLYHDGTRISV